MPESRRDCINPILVGGTGRSGSTVVGHLLDHHRDLVLTRPMEVRFIAGNDGLADALSVAIRKPGSTKAREAAELAVERLKNRWYQRASDVGLHTSVPADRLEFLSNVYLDTVDSDPIAATQRLVMSIMIDVAPLGFRCIDTTPANARVADRLELIYPQSKVIGVIRDGRDVAASFVQQTFGPSDVFEALAQWERRMLKMHKALLTSRPSRVFVVDLVDLVSGERTETLQQLCDFLEIPVDPDMVTWFDLNVTEQGAHGGRWHTQFDSHTAELIDQVYSECVGRLLAAGVRIPRVP